MKSKIKQLILTAFIWLLPGCGVSTYPGGAQMEPVTISGVVLDPDDEPPILNTEDGFVRSASSTPRPSVTWSGASN